MYHDNRNQRKAGMGIWISDNADFEPKKKPLRDKGTLLNDKRVHLHKGTAILYMYVHNTGAKYIRQEQRECKKK